MLPTLDRYFSGKFGPFDFLPAPPRYTAVLSAGWQQWTHTCMNQGAGCACCRAGAARRAHGPAVSPTALAPPPLPNCTTIQWKKANWAFEIIIQNLPYHDITDTNQRYVLTLICLPQSIAYNSVADPDPSDPYVFGPPRSGSESVSQRHGSRPGSLSFYHQAKIVRKPLIPTVLWLLFDF